MNNKQQYSEDEYCAICMENGKYKQLRFQTCNHQFCEDCIKSISSNIKTEKIPCPLCRQKSQVQEIDYCKEHKRILNEICITCNYQIICSTCSHQKHAHHVTATNQQLKNGFLLPILNHNNIQELSHILNMMLEKMNPQNTTQKLKVKVKEFLKNLICDKSLLVHSKNVEQFQEKMLNSEHITIKNIDDFEELLYLKLVKEGRVYKSFIQYAILRIGMNISKESEMNSNDIELLLKYVNSKLFSTPQKKLIGDQILRQVLSKFLQNGNFESIAKKVCQSRNKNESLSKLRNLNSVFSQNNNGITKIETLVKFFDNETQWSLLNNLFILSQISNDCKEIAFLLNMPIVIEKLLLNKSQDNSEDQNPLFTALQQFISKAISEESIQTNDIASLQSTFIKHRIPFNVKSILQIIQYSINREDDVSFYSSLNIKFLPFKVILDCNGIQQGVKTKISIPSCLSSCQTKQYIQNRLSLNWSQSILVHLHPHNQIQIANFDNLGEYQAENKTSNTFILYKNDNLEPKQKMVKVDLRVKSGEFVTYPQIIGVDLDNDNQVSIIKKVINSYKPVLVDIIKLIYPHLMNERILFEENEFPYWLNKLGAKIKFYSGNQVVKSDKFLETFDESSRIVLKVNVNYELIQQSSIFYKQNGLNAHQFIKLGSLFSRQVKKLGNNDSNLKLSSLNLIDVEFQEPSKIEKNILVDDQWYQLRGISSYNDNNQNYLQNICDKQWYMVGDCIEKPNDEDDIQNPVCWLEGKFRLYYQQLSEQEVYEQVYSSCY